MTPIIHVCNYNKGVRVRYAAGNIMKARFFLNVTPRANLAFPTRYNWVSCDFSFQASAGTFLWQGELHENMAPKHKFGKANYWLCGIKNIVILLV